MSADRPRRGVVLHELLLAMVLGALVASAVLAVLRTALRTTGTIAVRAAALRTLDAGVALLEADLRHATFVAGAAPVLTDSSAELATTVLVGPACGQPDGSLLLVLAADPFAAASHLRAQPDDDDALHLLEPHAPPDRWSSHAVAAVGSAASVACAGLTGAGLRLAVAPALAPDDTVPRLARVTRRVRWSAARGGDGLWWLVRRRCTAPDVCGAAEPVVGPLAAGARGLEFVWRDTVGATLAAPVADPTAVAAVDVLLRARPWRWPSPGGDSARFAVAIRDRCC